MRSDGRVVRVPAEVRSATRVKARARTERVAARADLLRTGPGFGAPAMAALSPPAFRRTGYHEILSAFVRLAPQQRLAGIRGMTRLFHLAHEGGQVAANHGQVGPGGDRGHAPWDLQGVEEPAALAVEDQERLVLRVEADGDPWAAVTDALFAAARARLPGNVDQEELAPDLRFVLLGDWALEQGFRRDPGSLVLNGDVAAIARPRIDSRPMAATPNEGWST